MTDTNNAARIDLVCGNCFHCQPGPNSVQDVMSRACYRNPPTANILWNQQSVVVVSVRPEIRVNTIACGEFETVGDESDDQTLMLPGMTS